MGVPEGWRKNWVTTVAGFMLACGTIPIGVLTAKTQTHILIPEWWVYCDFPLLLISLFGGIILGLASKGQDSHSTLDQVEQATNAAAARNALPKP